MRNESRPTTKKIPWIPMICTRGSNISGDENCPKKKLDAKMPEALPLCFAETVERNQALILVKTKPKPMPIKTTEKYNCAIF